MKKGIIHPLQTAVVVNATTSSGWEWKIHSEIKRKEWKNNVNRDRFPTQIFRFSDTGLYMDSKHSNYTIIGRPMMLPPDPQDPLGRASVGRITAVVYTAFQWHSKQVRHLRLTSSTIDSGRRSMLCQEAKTQYVYHMWLSNGGRHLSTEVHRKMWASHRTLSLQSVAEGQLAQNVSVPQYLVPPVCSGGPACPGWRRIPAAATGCTWSGSSRGSYSL